MRMMLLLLMAGCASGSFDRRPGQDMAEQIVWRGLYGEDSDPPPVEWLDDLVSADAGGITLPGWKVQVTKLNPGDMLTVEQGAISFTRYAHELMHWHTYLRTGDVDAAHWRGDWELANETAFTALWDAGL